MSSQSLKKVDLEQMERPKTLIVIHYKGKRVSIPLFEPIQNITEYLYHQLHKFQVTVLENGSHKHKYQQKQNPSITNIVCFTAREQDNNKLDLRMNILLSMSRLTYDQEKSRLDLFVLDLTSYYKFIEIQPYYTQRTKELIPEYQLYSVLSSCPHSTTYLGRKICDGRFYCIKFWRSDSRLGQREFNTFKILAQEQLNYSNLCELEAIPEVEEVRKAEQYLIIINEFCPGGNLKDFVHKKVSEIQCLHFMKQLIWGVYTLHKRYNLIHRALCFENIQVDFLGNLRIFGFEHSQPCFTFNKSSVPQTYDQGYTITNVITPPEVSNYSHYSNLVDYFNIGAVLFQLFYGYQANIEFWENKEQREGIDIAIQSLMSSNLTTRQLFVNEVIAELHEEKLRKSQPKMSYEHERLHLNKIQIGKSINIEQNMKNGIQHEQVIRIMKPSYDEQIYYLNPKGKKRMKTKEKSKSNSKEKGKISKEKSRISDGKKSSSFNKNTNTSFKSKKNKSKSKDSKSNKSVNMGSHQQSGKSKENHKRDAVSPKINTFSMKNVKSPPKMKPPTSKMNNQQVKYRRF